MPQKTLFQHTVTVLLITAIVATVLAAPGIAQDQHQQSMDRSQIVKITDPDEAFFSKVDEMRDAFERIAQPDDAFLDAENAARELAREPQNNNLKRSMIEARSRALQKTSEEIAEILLHGESLENVYNDMKNKLEVQIDEAWQSKRDQVAADNREVDFLADAVEQLKQLEAKLPTSEQYVSANLDKAVKLSQDELQTIAELKKLVEVSLHEVNLGQQSIDISGRHVEVLRQIRLQATQEYLSLRQAMANARADQHIFAAIARNDLTALKTITDEERLAKMASRGPVRYEGFDPSQHGNGYQWSELPGSKTDTEPVLNSLSGLIDKVETTIQQRSKSEHAETATLNPVKKETSK